MHTLRGAEWAGGAPMLTGAALFSGFYLNELLMKLLARHDPHPALFDAYAATVAGARRCRRGRARQAALRAFELVAAARDRPAARPRHRDRDAAAGARRAALPRAAPTPASSRPPDDDRGDRQRRDAAATLQAALDGGGLAALQQRLRAGRWPSCGRCCAPCFTIISAPPACARARSCSTCSACAD